jgi:hypothetical protein
VVGVGVGGGVGGVVAIGVDWDRDVFELVCVAMIGAWFVVCCGRCGCRWWCGGCCGHRC